MLLNMLLQKKIYTYTYIWENVKIHIAETWPNGNAEWKENIRFYIATMTNDSFLNTKHLKIQKPHLSLNGVYAHVTMHCNAFIIHTDDENNG